MSLRSELMRPMLEETTRVSRAAFPRGSVWTRLRDVLGPIYEDAIFAQLFSPPADRPKRPGGWRWSASCSSWSGWPSGRRRMLCGVDRLDVRAGPAAR